MLFAILLGLLMYGLLSAGIAIRAYWAALPYDKDAWIVALMMFVAWPYLAFKK